MKIEANTPRVKRSIGGKNDTGTVVSVDVQVPQPFAKGPIELTEGMASALNQIVAENLGNNLRQRIVEGRKVGEGDKATYQPYDETTAQALVDEYLKEYELGVRRAGSGERQVTDPVEREARKIAKAKAVQLVKDSGGKPADYDLAPITEKIFAANKDMLMKEGKRIVDTAAKAGGGLTIEGIELTPKAAGGEANGEGEGDESSEEVEETVAAE